MITQIYLLGENKNAILNPFYWYGVADVCGPGKLKMLNIQNSHFGGEKILKNILVLQ